MSSWSQSLICFDSLSLRPFQFRDVRRLQLMPRLRRRQFLDRRAGQLSTQPPLLRLRLRPLPTRPLPNHKPTDARRHDQQNTHAHAYTNARLRARAQPTVRRATAIRAPSCSGCCPCICAAAGRDGGGGGGEDVCPGGVVGGAADDGAVGADGLAGGDGDGGGARVEGADEPVARDGEGVGRGERRNAGEDLAGFDVAHAEVAAVWCYW